MIGDTIIKTYEDKLSLLSLRKQFHFLTRIYRITGNAKYIPMIRAVYKALLPKFKKNLEAIRTEAKLKELAETRILKYKHDTPRRAKRYSYYLLNPELLVYEAAILDLFIVKSLGMENSDSISHEFKKAKSLISGKNLERLFLSQEHIRVNPSESANKIFFLNFLGISDRREELLKTSKEYWLNLKPQDTPTWHNKIYALTHLIIAASNYYQNLVEKEKFDWILNYFDEDFNNIEKAVSLDSLGEIGLCYKLTANPQNNNLQKIKTILESKFDKKIGYIAHEKYSDFSGSEHRNTVAAMVLTDFDNLYKGPNIGDLK